jgi:hypothetical protein
MSFDSSNSSIVARERLSIKERVLTQKDASIVKNSVVAELGFEHIEQPDSIQFSS